MNPELLRTIATDRVDEVARAAERRRRIGATRLRRWRGSRLERWLEARRTQRVLRDPVASTLWLRWHHNS